MEDEKNNLKRDIDNYIANLIDPEFCEYSFFNTLRITDTESQNGIPSKST